MIADSTTLPVPSRRTAGHAGRDREAALDARDAMNRFLAEVERRAYRMAWLAVRDREAALDIVQEAMISLVNRYSDRPDDEWRPLFYRILGNRITDHQRRSGIRQRLFGWLGSSSEDDDGEDALARLPDEAALTPEREVGQEAAMQALEAALHRLPARQREAFLLRTLEGLDVAGTATAMGCSEGSVKTHHFRAIQALRLALGDHWP